MNGYLGGGGARTLDCLTGPELKRYLADLQGRGLSAETGHGCFATIRAFAGWAARESYEVDASVFQVRPPKVPDKEMETYSEAELEAVLNAARLELPAVTCFLHSTTLSATHCHHKAPVNSISAARIGWAPTAGGWRRPTSPASFA